MADEGRSRRAFTPMDRSARALRRPRPMCGVTAAAHAHPAFCCATPATHLQRAPPLAVGRWWHGVVTRSKKARLVELADPVEKKAEERRSCLELQAKQGKDVAQLTDLAERYPPSAFPTFATDPVCMMGLMQYQCAWFIGC